MRTHARQQVDHLQRAAPSCIHRPQRVVVDSRYVILPVRKLRKGERLPARSGFPRKQLGKL